MKILNIISLLIVPIIILNNNSYTMDDNILINIFNEIKHLGLEGQKNTLKQQIKEKINI